MTTKENKLDKLMFGILPSLEEPKSVSTLKKIEVLHSNIQLTNFIKNTGYFEDNSVNKTYVNYMQNPTYINQLEEFLMLNFKQLQEQTKKYLNET